MLEIKCSVDSGFTSGRKEVRDEQKRITIFLGDFVKALIVSTESERTIFLVYKKDRSAIRQTSRLNKFSSKVVINQFPKGLNFRLRKRVHWTKGRSSSFF
jgi:hypothetical protein